MSQHPDKVLASNNILSAQERHTLVVTWNDTATDFGEFAAVHQRFEAQVDRTPDAIALRFEGDAMNYRELDQRANQLARHLVGLGIGPDDGVAVLLARSFDMQVALFGILKAGGAYVPLDPHYPADRIAAMVEDSSATIVVGDSRWASCITRLELETVWLDRESLDGESNDRLELSIAPAQLAYVIFTSGSTGRPKGVMTSHENRSNELLALRDDVRVTADDVVLHKTPYTFSASVRNLFVPFITGASLVYAKPEGHKDPVDLAELIEREHISLLHFVPSMLEVFLESSKPSTWRSVTLVLCGGEALPAAVRDAFHSQSSAELINTYGPTETTTAVAAWRCERDTSSAVVPIGRPTANVQFYVVDAAMRLVPMGVPGELFVGGAQVTRGYVAHPELTEERFVPNPFDSANPRLYATGDMVRYRHDGILEFLGRQDDQVQLRGFRIELGEIEANLRSHGQVAQCVVVAREVAGSDQLVAYVVSSGDPIDSAALQAHLGAKLPSYMVPTLFVDMDALPLNNAGKLGKQPRCTSRIPTTTSACIRRSTIKAQSTMETLRYCESQPDHQETSSPGFRGKSTNATGIFLKHDNGHWSEGSMLEYPGS